MTVARYALALAFGLVACGLLAFAHATPPAVVPYYGATYGTPGGFSAADAKRVVELLESIDRRLEALEQRQAGGPVPLRKAPDLLGVAKAGCAACHTPAKADTAGGGFILFADEKAGALKPLSARERTRITEAVQSGTMPPGPKKLTPAEKSAFKW